MWSKLPPAGLPLLNRATNSPLPFIRCHVSLLCSASMSYTLAKSFKSAESDVSSPAISTDASPTQKAKGGNSDDTSAAKQKGSAKSKEGNSDYTSAAKQKGSAKSKDGPVAKQKGSASSKETAKGADLTYKSAKGAGLSKYVRSSLKPIESSDRVPDSASAMGAENSASVSDFKAAFIVSAFVAVGAALSAV